MGDGSLLADSFLSRNSWLPGVVVAVVLFLITTGLALHWRNRDKDSKHLDYQILSDTPIVTSRDRPEILKVIYGANKVSNPFITELRFKNTGKQLSKQAISLLLWRSGKAAQRYRTSMISASRSRTSSTSRNQC
ncbi:hypothetical protein [Mycobacterium avium]|uniref:hypothetical protein n=1 Tax=Mycobacterium avium TaxID=1764 RepID=UPI00111C8F64|nr:hypothetical protein [Mycobacterium avium]